MAAQFLAFLASLLKWPDGVVIKRGNTLETQSFGGSGEALHDDTGRVLFDQLGLVLTDSE